MKKLITYVFFLPLLACGFISCKKNKTSDGTAANSVSVSINGTQTTFNFGAKATITNVTGGSGIMIQGNKDNPSSSQTNISFSIASPAAITTGTYVENPGGNPLLQMSYVYDLALGILYTYNQYGSSSKPVTINISDINSTSVKGTFSGELSGTDVSGNPAKIVLTNGNFNVNF